MKKTKDDLWTFQLSSDEVSEIFSALTRCPRPLLFDFVVEKFNDPRYSFIHKRCLNIIINDPDSKRVYPVLERRFISEQNDELLLFLLASSLVNLFPFQSLNLIDRLPENKKVMIIKDMIDDITDSKVIDRLLKKIDALQPNLRSEFLQKFCEKAVHRLGSMLHDGTGL